MSTVLEEYVRKHPGSASRYQEARSLFPDGVTHDTRYVTPFPVFISHGKGPLKWDVDGNEYVDYVSGHGALLLGHSHPDIVSAVAAQVAQGTHLGASTEHELRWAQAIKRLMPSVEKVRFVSSGTEATMMALRLARAYTGKNKILKFEEHFHGWHDYASVKPGTDVTGIPGTTAESVVVVPAGDTSGVEKALSQDPDVAAVIVEPTGAHMGQTPLPVPKFLRDLREITKRYGVLLIMDEVVTGFRVSSGGAQVRFGIEPDMTTMAKIVAGSLPGGVVGGKGEVLDMIAHRNDPEWDKRTRIAHPGTFNANPLSAVAGTKCLEMVATQPINERADAMAARLKRGLNDVFSKMEVAGHVHGIASLLHLTFADCDCDREVCNMSYQEIHEAGEKGVAMHLKRAFLNAGVDLMARGSFIVSASHGKDEVDRTVAAFEKSLAALRSDSVV